jgi:hypothetical protein
LSLIVLQAFDDRDLRVMHPGFPDRPLAWLTSALDAACLEAIEFIHRGDNHGGNIYPIIMLYENDPEKLDGFLKQKLSINLAQRSAQRQVLEKLGSSVFVEDGYVINKRVASFQFWPDKDYPYPTSTKDGHLPYKWDGVQGVVSFDQPDKSVAPFACLCA